MEKYPNIIVKDILPEDFDHGGTRDEGIRMSDADVIVCMTQDAVPADENLIAELTEKLGEDGIAAAYARQLPGEDCDILERYTRRFNYPPESLVKSSADLERLGIKTYFCSNVCAAYCREIYCELGGFESGTIFNEDMIYAAKLIKSGYSIAYCAKALHLVWQTDRKYGTGQIHRLRRKKYDLPARLPHLCLRSCRTYCIQIYRNSCAGRRSCTICSVSCTAHYRRRPGMPCVFRNTEPVKETPASKDRVEPGRAMS